MRYHTFSKFSRTILFLLVIAGIVTSCSSSKRNNSDYMYFKNGADTILYKQRGAIIQPNDLLSIQVYSRTSNQDQAIVFNMPASTSGTSQGYLVSESGDIEFPILGTIRAAGLTKEELQQSLTQKLTNNVKNPAVIVSFPQFNINVLGEVRAPGTQKFLVDRVTIIDALSAAGDLTDFGRRENVMVIREVASKRIYYTIDLRSKAIFNSPVYLMQPNDIVYVTPNKFKLRTLRTDPEAQQRVSSIMSYVGIALTLINIFVYSLR